MSTFSKTIALQDPAFPIEFGRRYKIKVETLGDGNFESEFEPLLPVPLIQDLHVDSFITQVYDKRLDLILDIPLYSFYINTDLKAPGELNNSRLLWLNENFSSAPPSDARCNELNTIFMRQPVVFDGTQSNKNALQDLFLTNYRDVDLLNRQICFTVYQQSLSKSAFEYWEQLQEIIRVRDGNMLDPAIGQINTNIKATDRSDIQAFGYFYTTQQDTFNFTLIK